MSAFYGWPLQMSINQQLITLSSPDVARPKRLYYVSAGALCLPLFINHGLDILDRVKLRVFWHALVCSPAETEICLFEQQHACRRTGKLARLLVLLALFEDAQEARWVEVCLRDLQDAGCKGRTLTVEMLQACL